MKLRIVIKYFVFILCISSIFPQQNLKFHHLTVDDGLSQTTANAIMQDKFGFMWFGTQDGLNRYDGYKFKVFTNESGNKNSLSNNYIWSIHEDKDGIMWIGSFGGGLTRFDPATESFTNYKNDPNNQNSISSNDVFGIAEYPKGTLWLRTGRGVNKFDKKKKIFTIFLNTANEKITTNNLYTGALAVQPPSFVWASIDSCLISIDVETNELKYFFSYPENTNLKFGTILNLKYQDNNLFVCCNAGLVKIDLSSNTSSRIPVPTIMGEKKFLFNHLLIDDDYYWIGTNNGLILYDKNNNHFNLSQHNPDKPYSLIHNNIVSLYKSRDGIVWIGTYGGMNKIDRFKENFYLVQFDPSESNTISHKSIGPILEDKNGIVWFGTPDGLNAYNPSTGENIIFKNIPGKSNSLSSNYILSLYEDMKGNIWAGTRTAGISRFSYKNPGSIKNISFERIKLPEPSTRVQSICEDKNGIMWIGTAGRGLISYNYETSSIKSYPSSQDGSGPSHSFIYCMYEDSKGNFWLGTPTGGLNLFDREGEKFFYIKNEADNAKSLSNDIILSIFEDKKNQLWFGTSGGLNKLETPIEKNLFEKLKDSSITLSFTQYGKVNDLPNDVIYGILEDEKGFLWLSTNKGLVQFDPLKESPVKVFDVKDGLQNNEFNQNSFFKNKKGEMYFGGINGFNIFHSDSIKQNSYKPPVVFTDFKLFNNPVPLLEKDKKIFSLSKVIYQTDELELEYDHNVISFEFAALNFILPEKNKYAYKMEGFDREWINAGSNRTATYTNLDPGDYIFRVKASNNDGLWNERGASIKIFIPPPPWLSWYAYLFYIGIFFTAVFLFIRYKINSARKEIETHAKIERAKLEEREEVRKKSSADFHDEAGNKLTKISLFTELAKSEAENNPSLEEYLIKIEENTKEISSGMRDFIWVLDPAKDSLFDTISRLKDFGNSMFDYSDIRFNFKGLSPEMKNIALSMDARRALMLIFKEAINNCLKYSEAKNVEMSVSVKNNFLEVILKDDGKGFDLSEKSSGYGLNNMKERAKKIKCDYNIISEINKGTELTLKGNIPQMGN